MNKKLNFKEIADDVMSDIHASEKLKTKTLKRIMSNRDTSIRKYMVTAASVALILGAMSISDILPSNHQTGEVKNTEVNLLMSNENPEKTSSALVDSTKTTDFGSIKNWLIESTSEAKRDFGSNLLIPSYIPEGFHLSKIQATGQQLANANKTIFTYVSGNQSFLIMEEKTDMKYEFINYQRIEVNGVLGYLKPNTTNEEQTNHLDTELHWMSDGIHYSIVGQILDKEVIKIAKSMK